MLPDYEVLQTDEDGGEFARWPVRNGQIAQGAVPAKTWVDWLYVALSINPEALGSVDCSRMINTGEVHLAVNGRALGVYAFSLFANIHPGRGIPDVPLTRPGEEIDKWELYIARTLFHFHEGDEWQIQIPGGLTDEMARLFIVGRKGVQFG
jgi:hypothetical protein